MSHSSKAFGIAVARITGRRKTRAQIAYFVAALLIVVFAIMPIIYMILSSFKPDTEVFKLPPTFFPSEWTLDGYRILLNQTNIPTAFVNSVIVSTISSFLGIVISIGFCYSLTRFRFPGMGLIGYLMIATYMLPKILVMIPIYSLWGAVGLEEGIVPLTLIYASTTLPFAIWLMRSYFSGVPIELEEAAMVDGATRFQAFVKVILPLTRPGIIATTIFTFILSWNEVLFATLFATSQQTMVMSSALANLLQEQAGWFSWPMINAAGVVATVPMIVFFTIIQRQLVTGFTAGSIKG